MGGAREDVGGVIQGIITLVCGMAALMCILRQQRTIHKAYQALDLKNEIIRVQSLVCAEQAKQIQLLKTQTAMLENEISRK